MYQKESLQKRRIRLFQVKKAPRFSGGDEFADEYGVRCRS